MRLDVFGRELIVERHGREWRVFVPGEGKRRLAEDILLPRDLRAEEVGSRLADLLHERASPEHPEVRRLADRTRGAPPPVRVARSADAPGLARLAEDTFRGAFAADNRPEDMDAYCREAFGEEVQAGELRDAATRTLVAEHAGELVAYAQVVDGPAPPGVPAGRVRELRRIYVTASWQGTGLGGRLLETVVREAREEARDTLWLGVWERNVRALRFYERAGFRRVGEHRFLLGADPQRDLVMALALSP